MGFIQLGIEISDEEVKKIEIFFEVLKGKKFKIFYLEFFVIIDKIFKSFF